MNANFAILPPPSPINDAATTDRRSPVDDHATAPVRERRRVAPEALHLQPAPQLHRDLGASLDFCCLSAEEALLGGRHRHDVADAGVQEPQSYQGESPRQTQARPYDRGSYLPAPAPSLFRVS